MVICYCWESKEILLKYMSSWNFKAWLYYNELDALLSRIHNLLIDHSPSFYRDFIQAVKLGTCMFFSAVCPAGFWVIFLPWEMNLGGGAAVEGDYRPLSSKPWEETCCTTGYRKTVTTGLSSEYIQWTGALPLEGNQWNQWEREKKLQCPTQT